MFMTLCKIFNSLKLTWRLFITIPELTKGEKMSLKKGTRKKRDDKYSDTAEASGDEQQGVGMTFERYPDK